MTPLLTLVVYMSVLTFAAIVLGGVLRNREWTPQGMRDGFSNRDKLPEATPLGGRAQRAAANTIEGMLLFVPLALVAHMLALDAEVLIGAQVFFWSRVFYLPVYLAGIIYLRSLIWVVGMAGLGQMVMVLL
ncbi:MAG: MAPEG family protein [Halieaceae bacterium]|nr:MAPEG family protein [Halieaceae bacterium]